MSGQAKTFVSSMLEAGGYDPKTVDEDIDDAVDDWHNPMSWDDDERSLVECLGMTEAQYSRWFKDPDLLIEILHEHGVQERA